MSVEYAFLVPHPPIILPEVGRGEERKIAATSDAFMSIAAAIADIKPETIIISSPHAEAYADYIAIVSGKSIYGDMGRFGARGVSISCAADMDFVEMLESNAARAGLPAGTLGKGIEGFMDHGALIPLYFINYKYADYKLVITGISGLGAEEHYKFGRMIKETAYIIGKRAVFIASGDLSHKLKEDGPYGFSPEGPEFDKKITEALKHADFETILNMDHSFCEKAAECGLRPLQIMAGVLDGTDVDAELLSYEGPFGVGYATAVIKALGENVARCFI